MKIQIKQEGNKYRIIVTELGGGWKDRDYGLFSVEAAEEAIKMIQENNRDVIIDGDQLG